MAAAAAVAWALGSGPFVAWLLHLAAPAWSVMLSYHAGCWLASGAVSARLGPRPAWRGLAALGFLSTVATLAAFAVARAWVPALRHPVPSWERWGMRPPADALLLLYYAAANPWIEERFWRGAFLGERLRRRLGSTAAWLLAAAAFVPFHFAVLDASFGHRLAIGLTAPILGASVMWTGFCWRTGNAWWGAASHAGTDLALCLAYVLWLRP